MKRIVLGLIWVAMAARAENYALLVGISHYALGATHPWVNLEGPDNDVPRLKDALVRYGFAPDHITVLLDEDASQAAILEEVHNLVKRAGPGDLALFYFSGHGTSGFDAHFKQIAQQIGPDSGALIPYDVDPTSPEKALATLIIGKRDLRPILMGLNPRARGLVIMDACYSQDSAKGLDLRGTPRYLNMREFLAPGAASAPAGPPSIASIEQELLTGAGGNESPYSNVLSLAAAAKNETAADMGSKLLATGKVESVDGKPHGAFTNSLLKGLDGAADTNHDGSISVDELYEFTRSDVRSTFKHTPQLLEPDQGKLGEEIAFRPPGGAAKPAPKPAAIAPQPSGQKPVMVKLDSGATELHKRLEGIGGIILTQGDYDLLVRKTASGYELSDGSRTVIHNYGLTETSQLVGRVSAAPDVARLAQFEFGHQNFNAAVEVTSPAGQGSYADGQQLKIAVKTEAPAYLLLLDIDSTGTISTLYPGRPDAGQAAAKSAVPVIDTKVGAPFGTEFLKLFAFQEKPAGYDRWTCRPAAGGKVKCPEIEPGSPEFRELLAMLTQSDSGRAQAMLRLVTTEAGAGSDGAQQREFGAPDTKSAADPAAVAYQEAKVEDIAGDYAKALDGYRAAEDKMQAPRLQAVALYQEARMAAALGRQTDAAEFAARSVAKLDTTEGEALVTDLKRGGAPVPADAIARSLSTTGGRTMTLAADEPTVDLPIEFRFDSDAMTEGGRAQAVELGKALSRPEFGGTRFLVVGHTDSRGAASHNQVLSEQRARAVVRFLGENFGVDAKRLRPEGRGSREPISRGHTEEDYQVNRRVEVRVDR